MFRPTPFKGMKWLMTEMEGLLKAGVIRRSKTPYSFLIIIVHKMTAQGPHPQVLPMQRLAVAL